MTGGPGPGGGRRGRPRSTDRRRPLTRELIADRGLTIAGAEGFGALTMHRLAGELGVTPRALYNHVRDRQEVIDLVATLMMRRLPSPTLEVDDWRGSLRTAYRELRAAYRRFPRATLISLDETVRTAAVDPRRVTSSERMLRFLTGIGLTLPQALTVRGSFLIDVFGFVLLVDYRYDRGDAAMRRAVAQPVPEAWLQAHPEVEAPLSRAAAGLDAPDSDAMFDQLVDVRIAAIERLLD